MTAMQTPGVYVVEKNAFPNSVVEVATAVPAFVGCTRRADRAGKSLLKVPHRISSMAEYIAAFSAGPDVFFAIDEHADATTPAAFEVGGKAYDLRQPAGPAGGRFLLYHAMLHFFQNGGGPCFVVSVGHFDSEVSADALKEGIESLVREQEPTMLVVPDAVLLTPADCISVQQAMLAHCGGRMRNRVAILDIWGGARGRHGPLGDPVAEFRDALGSNFLDYAAAYYPWVDTTVVQESELGHANIVDAAQLAELIRLELALPAVLDASAPAHMAAQAKLLASIGKTDAQWAAERAEAIAGLDQPAGEKAKLLAADAIARAVTAEKALLDKSLAVMSPLFITILALARKQLNLLPPSAAMAGIYTMVDNTRGVWKAPANVSLNGVVSPAVTLTHEDQEDLNVTTQGKSINAIRAFIGEGTLVWGARTLDGNSLDWRYINVRRTMIMLEESCRLAAKALVFEPNVAPTWLTLKGMIRNFLTGIWKRGGLAGAVPDDAFSVHVGLGETMTPEDILEGVLRVTVLVAISRPAEFIEITFQQQMQAS